MASGNFKDLNRKAADQVLRVKHLILLKIRNTMNQRGLTSMVY